MQRPERNLVATAVIVFTLIVGAFCVYTIVREPERPTSVGQPLEPRDEPSEAPAPKVRTTVEDAMRRLAEQPQRPFRLAVIGDSTGVNADVGWVQLLINWIAEEYDRPAHVSWWSVDRNERIEWTANNEAPNAPLIVWNGSAGGKDFNYSRRRLDDLILPSEQKKIDLLFINHGHNLKDSTDYYFDGRPFIAEVLKSWPNTAIMLMAQNPERRGTPHASVGDRTINQVKSAAEWSGLPHLDVYELFNEASKGDTDSLLDDTDFHPNRGGYLLWFGAVRDTLLASMD